MTVFWHHVGDAMSVRDFPKTIGNTRTGNLKVFYLSELQAYLDPFSGPQQHEMADAFARIGEAGFQIWGVPAGAKKQFNRISVGDTLLLLNTDQDFGSFQYIGHVLLPLQGEHWKLSDYLWGEQKFPLILFLVGTVVGYPWPKFVEDMKYGSGIKGLGRLHSIGKQSLQDSTYHDEEGLWSAFQGEG
jgi:hypothetical protein